MAFKGQVMRGYGLQIVVVLVIMSLLQLSQAHTMAPSPAPSIDSASIDQGIAYILMLVALAVTYLLH